MSFARFRPCLIIPVATICLCCGSGNADQKPSADTSPTTAIPAPTLDELAAATFEGIYDEPVTLADLEGREWKLTELGRDDAVPDEVEITLRFAEGRAAGRGGCNRYSAGVTGKAPGELEIGPIAATKMACPGPAGILERRFFEALSGASSYSFLAGRLVLSCNTKDGMVALVFTESTADPTEVE